MRKYLLALAACTLFLACNEDDDTPQVIEIDITTENFVISIDENPSPSQEIGTVNAEVNEGTLSFEIESQSSEGAVLINSDSGLLTVGDAAAFDYELNTIISGLVRVSAGDESETLTLTININDLQEIIVTTSDFETTIDENPQANQLLGTIEGSTNEGEVSFTIGIEDPVGAFFVDEISGELRVANPALFDFEVNPTLTAVVEVTNEGVSESANVTVNLVDISDCIESNQAFQQELFDLDENDDNIELEYTLDLTTHEYTFTPNSNISLCSIGYQAFDETPYLMELVDGNDVVLFSELMTFSTSEQDAVLLSTPVLLLANETYTIRRIQEDYGSLEEIIGYIFLSETFSELNFPYVFEDITIVASNFYGTGGPIPNVGIPFISLGFE